MAACPQSFREERFPTSGNDGHVALLMNSLVRVKSIWQEADMKELNVTNIIPRERHPLIFEIFDGLNKGESFILINDHDPKPLYYQFLHERTGVFQWEYIEQGPNEWKVKISKH